MRVSTATLKQTSLDYAIAAMMGAEFRDNPTGAKHVYVGGTYVGGLVTRKDRGFAMPCDLFSPSTNASTAHAALQDRLVSLTRNGEGWYAVAKGGDGKAVAHGETMLVAGWHAAVIAEFGATIDIPDWLDAGNVHG